ncbi:MAG: hypothetical protein A3J72_01215 [Nitrospirae bacterium RIFCSPHIGHO2_02_FULL_40_19]|nr:MAG: hypothetical protein A3J72_01215 [Nitrospirae bacterium RIFCSPHIGHO2_02_FULL_40_19]
MRQFAFYLVCIILISTSAGCSKPVPTDVASGEIDTSSEPEQIPVQNKGQVIINLKNGKFSLKPVAEYSINAEVVSKKSYSYGWQAELAPIDLALAWGKLTEPESEKYVTFSQSDRWYYFEYKNDSPLNESYIVTHSSNNHIIPANENIQLAIKSIKKKDKVILKGFLVNAQGKYDNMDLWWNSSLTRNDTGDDSCEVFYVTKVKNGDYVYE